jgi:hypothetical protein
LLLFALALPIVAQEETPETVAKAYFAALQADDWTKAATYMHPESLESLKRTLAASVKLDKKNEVGKQLFNLKDNAEFEQLSPAEVFTRVITGLTANLPMMKEMLTDSQTTIIGQVPEAPDLLHIVYRMEMKMQNAPVTKLAVMSLKKSGDTWRMLLSGDMEAAFTTIAKALEAEVNNPAPAPAKAAPAKRPVRKR